MISIVVWGAVERRLRGVEMGGQAGKRVGIAFLLISSILFTGVASAKYSGGTGEPNNPYLIATPADLNDIGNHVEDFNKCFLMTSNIDLAPYTGTQFKIIGPNDTTPFTGIFNGNGHSISHFTYSSSITNAGLFGIIASNGVIRNINMIEPNVSTESGTYSFVGALAGYLDLGTVENCSAENLSVSGSGWYVGGLVGYNLNGGIIKCSTSGNVTGLSFTGGLVGCNYYGTVNLCHSSCGVTVTAATAGGLVGSNHNSISQSYATGAVQGGISPGSGNFGGLVGENSGYITGCYATGNVTGVHTVGGLAGRGGVIIDCYARGNVNGTINVGGLAGSISEATDSINRGYSTGLVTGAGSYVGGLVGYKNSSATVTYGYWDINTSGQATSAGGVGKTTAQMQTKTTYIDWMAVPAIWNIQQGVDYPHLLWEGLPGEPIQRYSGGTGEPGAPYLIATPADLNDIGKHVEDFNKCFLMTSNIDLAPYTGTQFKIIGNEGTPFAGVFDGGGHSISNFEYLPTTYYDLGLFSYVGANGIIRNVNLVQANVSGNNRSIVLGTLIGCLDYGTVENCSAEDVSVTGEASIVGGLIGRSYGGKIEICSTSGNVFGSGDIGGLVGYSDGEVVSCSSSCFVKGMEGFAINVGGLAGWSRNLYSSHSTGTVQGYYYVGGLTGNNDGNIVNCFSTSNVYGTQEVGGLIGEGGGSKIISGCYASGAVQGELNVGGLAGRSKNVSFCYSTGTVQGEDNVGGLIGFDIGQTTCCYSYSNVSGDDYVGGLEGEGAVVINCYARGAVNGDQYVGGLIGRNSHTIDSVTNAYSTGLVVGTGSYVGGLIGANSGAVNYGYWDVNTSGQTTSAAGIGKTTEEMHTVTTYMGWGSQPAVWTIQQGVDYPHLIWEGLPGEPIFNQWYAGGCGEADDPYLIGTAQQLNTIGLIPDDWGKCFKLIADIDMAGIDGNQFNIIGSTTVPFTGVFDGNCHTISNLTYDGNGVNYVGLFGYVDGLSAEIKSVGLINPHINAGAGGNVGALVGYNIQVIISECWVRGGSISGDSYVGGLIGCTYGTLLNSYASTDVSGSANVGGLAGYNGYIIRDCYSTGPVSGVTNTGGLVGGTGGSGKTYDSYWDIQESGQDISAGGEGKTTALMQQADTFGGWGCDGGWTIDNGNDYPRLVCENVPGEPIDANLSDYFEGSGTSDAPYLISDAAGLNMIGQLDCVWDKHFKLVADIDMSGVPGDAYYIIGMYEKPFTGVFDGGGHTISNLNCITNSDYVGLFGVIDDANSYIFNLRLVNPHIEAGSGSNVGSLAGLVNKGNIIDCNVEGGSVSGTDYVGGSAGQVVAGQVLNCYSSGSVSGHRWVGGFIGSAGIPGTIEITNCHSNTAVFGADFVGGFAGRALYGPISIFSRISGCTAIVQVSATGSNVGGFSGYNDGNLSDCGVWGDVSGLDAVGGLVGSNGPYSQIKTSRFTGTVTGRWNVGGIFGSNLVSSSSYINIITSSYAEGQVAGDANVGGLAGRNSGKLIKSCYSACELSGNSNVGGLVGYSSNYPPTNCVWDIEISEINKPCGYGNYYGISSRGRTTEQMKSAYAMAVFACDPNWTIDDGVNNPRLSWENEPGKFIYDAIYDQGTGEPEDPILIYKPEQLLALGWVQCIFNKSFRLANDLNLADYNLADYFIPIGASSRDAQPAGTGAFTGIFDGDGHIISDFNCNYVADMQWGDQYSIGGGLFGGLDANAQVKNVGMLRPNIVGYGPSGSLVGSMYKGTVSNCFSAGGRIINSAAGTGGLVGELMTVNARILDSYSTTDVCGPFSGGLAGYCAGEVNRCYSAGSVSQYSTYPVGGLISSGGALVRNSFWDVDTSGRTTSAGGTGLTTEQMMTRSFFADAGWDFNDVWRICETTNYPKLLWQIPMADYLCPDGVDFVDYSYLASHWLQTDYGDCNGVDLTGDGIVNALEFAILADYWGQTGYGNCGGADYSGDGSVDTADLATLCSNWLIYSYGDVEGADLTGDGIVDLDDALEFSRQWLQGF